MSSPDKKKCKGDCHKYVPIWVISAKVLFIGRESSHSGYCSGEHDAKVEKYKVASNTSDIEVDNLSRFLKL